MYRKCFKTLSNDKYFADLGESKHNRDKLIVFLQKKGDNEIKSRHTIGTLTMIEI